MKTRNTSVATIVLILVSTCKGPIVPAGSGSIPIQQRDLELTDPMFPLARLVDPAAPGPPEPVGHETASVFLLDQSESIEEYCPKDQQALRHQLPAFLIRLLNGLDNYPSDAWPQVGVLGFTSDVNTVLPLGPVAQYTPADLERLTNEMQAFDAGNDYPSVLEQAQVILASSQVKMAVLITDGWFKDAGELRTPTKNRLATLASDGVSILMIRLACPIPPTVYSTSEQNADENLWRARLPDHIIETDGKPLAELVQELIERPEFAHLLPGEEQGWNRGWMSPSNSTIPIDVPGETWRVKVGVVSMGTSGFELDWLNGNGTTRLQPRTVFPGVFGASPSDTRGPRSDCRGYQVQLRPEYGGTPAPAMYWSKVESLDPWFQVAVGANKTQLLNEEPFELTITSVVKADLLGAEHLRLSFGPCYRVMLSVLDEDGNVLRQRSEPLSIDLGLKWPVNLKGTLDHVQTLTVVAQVVKAPVGTPGPVAVSQSPPISMPATFSPKFVEKTTDMCVKETCTENIVGLIYDYGSPNFYEVGATPIFQAYLLTDKKNSLTCWSNPDLALEVTVPAGHTELFARHIGDDSPANTDGYREVKWNRKDFEGCGYLALLVQPAGHPEWPAVYCDLDTQGCDKTDQFRVDPKRGSAWRTSHSPALP